jgi:hypothetical protein
MSEAVVAGQRPSRRLWATSGVCGAVVILALALSLSVASYPSFRADVPSFTMPTLQSIDACLRQISATASGPAVADDGIAQLCYARSYRQAMLNELEARRIMVLTQVYEERIALWLVVWVTSFGVIFAGAQIAFSVWLAAAGRGGGPEPTELAVQRGKVVVRSSIVGVSMLAISWVFFLTFAATMYPRTELAPAVDAQRNELSGQTPAPAETTAPPPGKKLRSVPASPAPTGE